MIICELFLSFTQVKPSGLTQAFLQTLCGTIAVLIPLYLLYETADIPRFSTTLTFVWTVMILIYAGTHILSSKSLRTDTTHAPLEMATPIKNDPNSAKPRVKILERLPVHLQDSQLYALSAEDHYVRIYTSKGDAMVLMRFSDAVTEAESVNGLQIHRSWWVSRSAVGDIKPKGRSAEITLKNDIKAPVSRNALKVLRENRWL